MKFAVQVAMFLLTGATCLANSAVSGTNGKLGVLLGSMDSESAYSVEGSVTWPIQERYGLQIDALYSHQGQRSYGFANVGDLDVYGLGFHLFWRESETALVGLQAGYLMSDPVDSWEIGLEAERYFEWITLGGKAGIASIRFDHSPTLFEADDDAFYFQFYLGFYPTDDLWISLNVERRFDNTFYGVELEYELPGSGWSVFANAMKGDHGYDHAMIGMRYYFGSEPSLKMRHRRSDPKNQLHSIQHGVGVYRAEVHRRYVEAVKRSYIGSGGTYGGSITIGGSPTFVMPGIIGPGSGGGSLTLQPGVTVGGGNLLIPPSMGLPPGFFDFDPGTNPGWATYGGDPSFFGSPLNWDPN